MLIVYGAYGATGRRILELAVAAGELPVAAGRDRHALEQVAGPLGLPVRVGSLEAGELDRVCDGATVVISCVAPYETYGTPVLEGALRARAHYVDCTGEPRWVARLIATYDREGERQGSCIVPAAGIGTCANLAAKAAAVPLTEVDAMSVAYRIRGMRPSAGTSRSTVRILAGGCPVVEHGQTRFITPGRRRRRFANGDAISFPLTDPLTFSRIWPAARTDSYLQSRGAALLAPLLGVAAAASRRGLATVAMRHAARLLPDDAGVGGAFRVTAVATRGPAVSTVVADAPNVYDVTGSAAFEVARTLLRDGAPRPGVRATGQVVGDPQAVAARVGIQLTHLSPLLH